MTLLADSSFFCFGDALIDTLNSLCPDSSLVDAL